MAIIRAPECIDALEVRIASNVEYFQTERYGIPVWFVQSKSFSQCGTGYTIENAVISFLVSNKLEIEQ